MPTAYAHEAISYVWVLFVVIWFSAAVTTKPRDKSAGAGLRLPLAIILVAAVLLFHRPIHASWLSLQLLPNSPWLIFPGAALTIAGMALAFWARFHLGRNWGPPATMRVGHELVTSGPYAFIRHPIYVGASVALFGTFLALGNALMALLMPIVVLRFWWAARKENQLLARQFGERADQR